LPFVLAVVAVAVVLVPAAGAQARRAVPKAFFGLTEGPPVDAQDLEQMRAINVGTMRVSLNWAKVEPRQGTFSWPDEDIAALARAQIRPVVTFHGAPQWATGSTYRSSPPLTKESQRMWQMFVKAAVARYGTHGTFWRENPDVPVEAVRSWQIWNEPNLPKFFARPDVSPPRLVEHAPEVYARLVKLSDAAIASVDPRATVVLAGLLGNRTRTNVEKMAPNQFLKRFLRVPNVIRHFDAAALHPYLPNITEFKGALRGIRGVMKKHGAADKGLWLTEVGWGSSNDGFRLNKGEDGQARLLSKSFGLTLESRRRWHIGHVFWFDWRDPTGSALATACSFCGSAGLLRSDRSHKPSFSRFKHFTEMQGGRLRSQSTR
jgi:hypothetical protein